MESRRVARELALVVFYQAELKEESPLECVADAIARETSEGKKVGSATQAYLERLVGIVSERMEEIDGLIANCLEHWKLERLLSTDRNVLRVAVGELLGVPDVPAKVVIDEAIEIARRFGSDNSAAFVNGVLDRIAKQTRLGLTGRGQTMTPGKPDENGDNL